MVNNMEMKNVDVEDNKKGNRLINFIKELVPYVIILLAVIIIRTYFFTPIMVSGPSMQPTLDGGELMILSKNDSDIKRFDIVVVDIDTEDIIKRVVAMPGETISCENGIVYVNGKKQEEEYSKGITADFPKVTLDYDEYFVMGDNRENSLDSRKLGPIKNKKIKGVTSLVLFPFNKIGNVE